MKFITEGTGTEGIKKLMVLYLPGNFQVFRDLALWVVLVYDTRSKKSQYNNAQFMHKLYIFFCMPSFMHKSYIFLSMTQSDRWWEMQSTFQCILQNRHLKKYAKLVAKSLFIQ